MFFLAGLMGAHPAYAGAERLDLHVNEGSFYKLTEPVVDVLVTNPAIADAQFTQGNGLFVYGKRAGRTHILAVAKNDKIIFNRLIEVRRSLAALETTLDDEFGAASVRVVSSAGRLIVSGQATSHDEAGRILDVIRGYLDEGEEIVNRIAVPGPGQVNLKVRIVEVNRRATKDLGINWDILLNPGSITVGLLSGRSPFLAGGRIIPQRSLAGGQSSAVFGYAGDGFSVNSVIDALVEDNLVTVLAEPNLTSRSGEKASFFAGGEFPVPVSASDDRITVQFKQFGVILDMTPTVLSPDRISLHIRPEVSELSSSGAVVIDDVSIPGISIRRTEATIELASGQSFAVAGLLQNRNRNLVKEVPWLADLNVLGPLFRSSRYQNEETELVIIATANLVQPLSRDDYTTPLAGLRENSQSRKLKTGRNLTPSPVPEIPDGPAGKGGRVYGAHGYIY
ncbi:type II and III secretion system protein family protein [Sneathiella chinensis]|nr:type II and III secretion system protein family protein [Sneathiella chinensis]